MTYQMLSVLMTLSDLEKSGNQVQHMPLMRLVTVIISRVMMCSNSRRSVEVQCHSLSVHICGVVYLKSPKCC